MCKEVMQTEVFVGEVVFWRASFHFYIGNNGDKGVQVTYKKLFHILYNK
jgi:hypothetical protein